MSSTISYIFILAPFATVKFGIFFEIKIKFHVCHMHRHERRQSNCQSQDPCENNHTTTPLPPLAQADLGRFNPAVGYEENLFRTHGTATEATLISSGKRILSH